MAANGFAHGAAHAAGSKLTEAVLQTPQGQQAIAFSAKEIATGTASLLTTVAAAGTVIAAAGPIFAVGAVGFGLLVVGEKIWDRMKT